MSVLGLNSQGDQSDYDSEEQKRNNIIGGLMWLVLPVVLFIVGGFAFYNMHSANRTHDWLGNNGVQVSARCIVPTYGGKRCPYYEFTVEEKTYRVSGSGYASYIRLPDKRAVFYDPSNPSINRLADSKAPYELDTMYVGIVATFVLLVLGKLVVEPIVKSFLEKEG